METVRINSDDYWVKVVEMLQQNWALVDLVEQSSAQVYFISDGSGVFDQLTFPSAADAEAGLRKNGFRRFSENRDLQEFLRPPQAPFRRSVHPNGPIYSSGRFWRE